MSLSSAGLSRVSCLWAWVFGLKVIIADETASRVGILVNGLWVLNTSLVLTQAEGLILIIP